MSRILRRPMFRGGSTSNEGIMSVPRRGYSGAGSVNSELDYGYLGDDRETSGLRNMSNNYYGGLLENNNDLLGLGLSTTADNTTESNEGTIDRGILTKKLKEADIADELGLSPLGKRFRDRYLSQRADPLGKFLINFGLNYMSARPKGGKFGALTTAAEAAKKPTEQLYADQDTEAALELKLLSAFGKEKDTDIMKIAKAYAEKYGGTPEDYLALIGKRRAEASDLKDYSDRALIRKFGEDFGKDYKTKDPIQQQNAGIFKLRLERNELPEGLAESLAPGKTYIESDEVKQRKDNPNILDIVVRQEEYNPAYKYINPVNKGIYGVQEQSGKRFLYKIGQYK